MCNYLEIENRKQESIPVSTAGVPQGSNDGARLLHLYINELILFVTDTFCVNYKDDDNV